MSVLIADDEPEILDILSEVLRLDGFAVHTASDGLAALDIVAGNEIDIILSDQRMPRLSGVETLKRSRALRPNAQRILLTAYVELAEVISSINEAHVAFYLVKPLDPQQVLAAVRSSAEKVLLQRENSRLLARLEEYTRTLEATVQQRTKDLVASNEMLVAVQRQRDEMIRMAVHDLRNPLASIRLVIDEAQATNRSAGMSHLFEAAAQSTRSMDSILHSLTMISKLDSQADIQAEEEPVDVSFVAGQCCELWKLAAARKSIDFSAELIPIGQAVVTAEEMHIREVVDNLLSNAVKYCSPGQSVHVQLHVADGTAVLRVRDTGQGLDTHDVQHAFEEFRRLSSKPTGGESSTGLGLAIIKKICERYGGRAEVYSEGKGKGCTFTVWLPTHSPGT